MQFNNRSPFSIPFIVAAPSSRYYQNSQKTNFKMLQVKHGYKPEPFNCEIKWGEGKSYGEIFAKTPWGENYFGFIESAGPSIIHKGFVYSDSGSVYVVEMKAHGSTATMVFKPIHKDGSEAHGVAIKTDIYHKKYRSNRWYVSRGEVLLIAINFASFLLYDALMNYFS